MLIAQFGAACGLLVGHGVRAMVAHINPEATVSLSLYAVTGAAAFLSGCVRYKSTAILIAMESTGAWFLIVPVAIAGGAPYHTCGVPHRPADVVSSLAGRRCDWATLCSELMVAAAGLTHKVFCM